MCLFDSKVCIIFSHHSMVEADTAGFLFCFFCSPGPRYILSFLAHLIQSLVSLCLLLWSRAFAAKSNLAFFSNVQGNSNSLHLELLSMILLSSFKKISTQIYPKKYLFF